MSKLISIDIRVEDKGDMVSLIVDRKKFSKGLILELEEIYDSTRELK